MSIDKTCILSGLLFSVGNVIQTISFFKSSLPTFDLTQWEDLDPAYTKQRWHRDGQALELAGGLLVTLAWFVFTIPMIQLAWILSRGGKRRLPLHTIMVLLVIGGSFTELIARLIQLGMMGMISWLSRDFNLSDWNETSDNIGWRTLELVSTVVFGMLFWVDAFEWLAMSGITIIIVISVKTLPASTRIFSNFWSNVGILLACCCVIEFLSDVLRLASWTVFQNIAAYVSLGTTTILLPAWLYILGSYLPTATPAYNEEKDDFPVRLEEQALMDKNVENEDELEIL